MINWISSPTRANTLLRWGPFLVLFGFTCIMSIYGGATHISGSGLPLVFYWIFLGVLPPVTVEQWEITFLISKHYPGIPEYHDIHPSMSLDAFKSIFWSNHIYHFWGRCISVLLGLCTWSAYKFTPRLLKLLIILWAIGLYQAFMGWGLLKIESDPLRLVLHVYFSTFTLILTFSCFYQTSPWPKKHFFVSIPLYLTLIVFFVLVAYIMIYGAIIVAFTAGDIYNTFPLIQGFIFPSDFFFYKLWWSKTTTHPPFTQWHAPFSALICLGIYSVIFCLGYHHRPILKLGVLLIIQILLEILLNTATEGVFLWAILHQGWAIFLLFYSLLLCWQSKTKPKAPRL